MARTGRPTKLDPERVQRLCDAIRGGNLSLKVACSHAGIHYTTLRTWLKKGEKAKSGDYHDLHERVSRARHDAEMRNVAAIQQAAIGYDSEKVTIKERAIHDLQGNVVGREVTTTTVREKQRDWRAAAWWLERVAKDRWLRNHPHPDEEPTGEVDSEAEKTRKMIRAMLDADGLTQPKGGDDDEQQSDGSTTDGSAGGGGPDEV